MSTQTISNPHQLVGVDKHAFSFLETHMLRHAHPRKVIFDVVAMIWMVYFLWQNDLALALLSLVIIGGSGLILSLRIDSEKMAQTMLGRLALLHLKPINFALNLLGTAGAFYGLWSHSALVILGSVSVIIFGHLQGWDEVDARLKLINKSI